MRQRPALLLAVCPVAEQPRRHIVHREEALDADFLQGDVARRAQSCNRREQAQRGLTLNPAVG